MIPTCNVTSINIIDLLLYLSKIRETIDGDVVDTVVVLILLFADDDDDVGSNESPSLLLVEFAPSCPTLVLLLSPICLLL